MRTSGIDEERDVHEKKDAGADDEKNDDVDQGTDKHRVNAKHAIEKQDEEENPRVYHEVKEDEGRP